MRLWRISDYADRSGEAGLRISGRWHSRGRKVVYLADHPASPLLEVLVHLEVDREDLPDTYQLLAIDVPDDLRFESIEENQLAPGWRGDGTLTRGLGDRWLNENRTGLLRVPSAIVPFAWNWLLNPAHPDSSKLSIAGITRALFDARLFKTA